MTDDQDLSHPRLAPFLDRARIECGVFEFQCPQQWGALNPTPDPQIRHCDSCDQPVHLVVNEAQLRERAANRQCIAVVAPSELPPPHVQNGPDPLMPTPPPVILSGAPLPPPELMMPQPSALQRALKKLKGVFGRD